MKRLQQKFKQAALFLEEIDLGLRSYIYLFLAILAFRLCLEFFANQKLFSVHDVIHIGLWFTFIVLAFIVQLHLFSKVDLTRILKLCIVCFSIALTAPIIDLIISQGKLSKMNYLAIRSFQDFLFSYFTIGGASLTRGATIGIRVEIILLMLASFNYIYVKRSNLLIAFLGSFSIYTVLFLSGTIPLIVNYLSQALRLPYAAEDHSTELLLFCIDLLLILYISNKIAGKKTARPLNLSAIVDFVFCFGALLYGAILARRLYPDNWGLNASSVFHFPILALVLLLFFRYLNYKNSSLATDKRNEPYEIGFWLLVLTSGLIISFYCFFALLLIWAALFILYEKPTVWIKSPVLSVFFQSILYAFFVFFGFLTFGAPLIGIDLLHLVILLLILLVIRILSSIIVEKISKTL